jgi:hypothetical protein
MDSFAAIRTPNAATIMNWLRKAARYKKEKLIFWQWTNCDNVQREFLLAQILSVFNKWQSIEIFWFAISSTNTT